MIAVVLLFLPGLLAQPSPTDLSRRPNWSPATYAFGSCGSEAGQFREPAALAFGAGDVLYVVDSGNHRIQVFSVDGRRSGGWGKAGSGEGEFLFPEGIAVTADGEVYVADSGNRRIQVFSPRGVPLNTIHHWTSHRGGLGGWDTFTGLTVDRYGHTYATALFHPASRSSPRKGTMSARSGGLPSRRASRSTTTACCSPPMPGPTGSGSSTRRGSRFGSGGPGGATKGCSPVRPGCR